MGLYDFTLYDLINRNAICYRDKPAWFEADDGRTLTFLQYKQMVDRLACGLIGAGIKKGDRVGVVAKNSLEYFVLYGAAAALGAIMLPINWRLSPEEVAFNLNDGSPKIVFADIEHQELMQGLQDQLPSVTSYFNLGAAGHFKTFETLMDHAGAFEAPDLSADDGFVIIHTAAVAGRPRGALLSHGNVLCANLHFDYLFQVTEKDVHLNFLPLFHVGGLFMLTTCFHVGALNINMSKFDAGQATELIEEKQVSIMFTFAPILASVLDEHEKTGKSIKSLRVVTGLDTPETIEKYQQLTGGTFFSLYGQTETSAVATYGPYNARPGAAGKMLPLTMMQLVDDNDKPVETGQVGEICIKGPMVFKGYWNLPRDTAETFRGGWHHTGDLGRFDADGFMWYAGRKPEKELIKPGGENVYPAEVEKVILEHPAVEKTVVFGVPHPKWKEGIKAVCQLKEGQNLTQNELVEFVGSRIARYKKPSYVEFVSDLPLTADGLPDREEIKARYGA